MCDNNYQKIYHPIKLTQKTKCETSLSLNPKFDKAKLKGITRPYFGLGSMYTDPTVWNGDIFISNDEKNCPITGCSKYLTGCNTPISKGIPGNVRFFSDKKIQITLVGGTLGGWREEYCIVCTNGAQEMKVDNFVLE